MNDNNFPILQFLKSTDGGTSALANNGWSVAVDTRSGVAKLNEQLKKNCTRFVWYEPKLMYSTGIGFGSFASATNSNDCKPSLRYILMSPPVNQEKESMEKLFISNSTGELVHTRCYLDEIDDLFIGIQSIVVLGRP